MHCSRTHTVFSVLERREAGTHLVSFCFPCTASIEELCAVDLYGLDAHVHRAKLASVVSACKQLHGAGFLHVVAPSQVTVPVRFTFLLAHYASLSIYL